MDTASSLDRRTPVRSEINLLSDDLPHFALLLVDFPRRVNHRESERVNHAFILVANLPLEYTKTLVWIRAPSHVESCFMVLELGTPLENSIERTPNRRAKIKVDCRRHRKAVQLLQPRLVASTHRIPRKCRINIAVRQHDRP